MIEDSSDSSSSEESDPNDADDDDDDLDDEKEKDGVMMQRSMQRNSFILHTLLFVSD